MKTTSSTKILKTKLFAPRLKPNDIERKQLFGLLDEGLNYKLTLLCSPAGFGKSTALSQWAHQAEIPVTWISLDQRDNDFRRFFIYLLSASEKLIPKINHELASLIELPELPDIEYLLALFIQELEELETSCVYVLDDYHVIQSPTIHQSIEFLIRHLPPHIHFFISSRTFPENLPLAQLRVQQELCEIPASTLQFQSDDIDTLFKQSGLELEPLELQTILDKTEGWALSLQMLNLSLRASKNREQFIQIFSGNDRYIADFLIDEVLSNLSKPLTHFLLKTSIVNRFNADLCQYLIQQGDARALIEELEHNNLFIIPLDNQRQWYRYHNLFAELLYQRSKQTFNWKALHLRASQWLAQQGNFSEAIDQALLAEQPQEAALLMEKVVPELVSFGKSITVLNWIKQLPDEVILSTPKICVYYGCALVQDKQLNQAEQWIDTARALYSSKEAPRTTYPVLSQLINIQATLAFNYQEYEEVIQYSKSAIESNPSQDPSVHSAAHLNQAVAHMTRQSFSEALKEFEKGILYLKKTSDHFNLVSSEINCARLSLIQGDWKKAHQRFQDNILLTSKLNLSSHSILGHIHIHLAQINADWNLVSKSMEHIALACKIAKHSPIASLIYLKSLYIAIELEQNEWIEKLLNALMELNSETSPRYQTLIAYLALKQGRLMDVDYWARSNPQIQNAYNHEPEVMTLGLYLLHEKKSAEAVGFLKKMSTQLRAINARNSWLKISILYAVALNQNKQTSQAEKVLIEALTPGSEQNFLHPVLLHAAHMIKRIPLNTYSNDYLKHLRFIFKSEEPEAVHLSNREYEILQLLEKGLSNQEISESLFVSLNTTKTHIKKIFRKLAVSNRAQALVKAYEYKLL